MINTVISYNNVWLQFLTSPYAKMHKGFCWDQRSWLNCVLWHNISPFDPCADTAIGSLIFVSYSLFQLPQVRLYLSACMACCRSSHSGYYRKMDLFLNVVFWLLPRYYSTWPISACMCAPGSVCKREVFLSTSQWLNIMGNVQKYEEIVVK